MLNIVFIADGNDRIGSYRIPFIGMKKALLGSNDVEVLQEEEIEGADVVFCLAGQGYAYKIRHKYPSKYIVIAKPHYEIGYHFALFRNPIETLLSIIRLIRPRAWNSAFRKHQRDVSAANLLIADSRKINRRYMAEGKKSIFVRLVEDLPNIVYTKIAFPKEGSLLNICYHGNPILFDKYKDHFEYVLSCFTKKYRVVFYVVTNNINRFKRIKNNDVTVKYIDYEFSKLIELLPNMHIGFVPNSIKSFKLINKKLLSLFVFGSYQDNLEIFAEKLSSNAGRAYLFAHFGVPFIACPSEEILLDFGDLYFDLGFPTNKEEWLFCIQSIISNKETYEDLSKKLIQKSKKVLNIHIEAKKIIDFLNMEVSRK